MVNIFILHIGLIDRLTFVVRFPFFDVRFRKPEQLKKNKLNNVPIMNRTNILYTCTTLCSGIVCTLIEMPSNTPWCVLLKDPIECVRPLCVRCSMR